MDEKKYLNEEKYQKTEKGITVFAILIYRWFFNISWYCKASNF